MATRKIEHKAVKGEVFTLAEVEAFVADARRSGATGTEMVGGAVSWGQKIQKLSVDVEIAVGDAVPLDKG